MSTQLLLLPSIGCILFVLSYLYILLFGCISIRCIDLKDIVKPKIRKMVSVGVRGVGELDSEVLAFPVCRNQKEEEQIFTGK